MPYHEGRGDESEDWCMDDADSGVCMDAAEIEAGPPPKDERSEKAANPDEGGDSDSASEPAAGAASHPVVVSNRVRPCITGPAVTYRAQPCITGPAHM